MDSLTRHAYCVLRYVGVRLTECMFQMLNMWEKCLIEVCIWKLYLAEVVFTGECSTDKGLNFIRRIPAMKNFLHNSCIMPK